MRTIYKLNEDDIKKILADHFEALPEEVEITHMVDRGFDNNEQKVKTEITIDTVVE